MRSREERGRRTATRRCSFFETLECRTHLSGTIAKAPASTGVVDLTGAVAVTSSITTVKQGRSINFAVTITNAGTATATGALAMDLAVSSEPDGTAPTASGLLRSAIHLKAGGSVTLHFLRSVGLSTPAGTYYYVVTIDPSDSFKPSDTTNSTVVSSNSFAVIPLYPVLASTYTGDVNVIAGPDRGEFGDITTYISTESSVGALSGDGTVDYENGVSDDFTFEGRVSQNGVVTERLLVSTGGGNVSLVTAVLVGNTITGTYRAQGDLIHFSETAIA